MGAGRFRRRLLVGAVALVALVGTGATSGVASAAPMAGGVAGAVQLSHKPAPAPDFGPNVTIFTPDMPTSEIKAKFDEIHANQVDNEMGSERYGLYFMPGTYGTATEPLQVKVGYYTEVAGLGAMPGDVQINGAIEVYNRCFDDPTNPEFVGCFALNNFWRGMSNLTINVNTLGQGGCEATANMWAVSQAVSLRRVDVMGGTFTLMDYCSGPSFASGGYIADSRAGTVVNGSQQQWYARNSEVGVWSNAVWNQVFSGMNFTGDPAAVPVDASYPEPPYTVLERTPLSREKPYLYVDSKGKYLVRVPSTRKDTSGISWATGMTPGRSIPIRDFFIADPSDSVQEINKQLARGKHLILTPGVYDVGRSIQVKRADTVVLGMGLATLTAVNGATPLTIADTPGVMVAGVTIDGGEVESPVLLQVGKPNGDRGDRKDQGHKGHHQHRPQRPDRQRRQRHRDRSVRRATSRSTTPSGTARTAACCSTRTSCPTTRPPRRTGHSRTARSAGPGTRSPTMSRPTSCGAAGCTRSTATTPRS